MKKHKLDSLFDVYYIIVFIGLCFIIMGFFYMGNVVNINSFFIYGVAFAGTFFVIADILRNLIIMLSYSKLRKIYIIQQILYSLRIASLFLSFFHLIVTPYRISLDEKIDFDTQATGVSILAIGLTIFNIGLNFILDHIKEEANKNKEIQYTLEVAEKTYATLLEVAESKKEAIDTTSKAIQLAEEYSLKVNQLLESNERAVQLAEQNNKEVKNPLSHEKSNLDSNTENN